MFMRIDRRFMAKCFGQMQELGIYPGQIPVLGLLAHKDGLSQREIAEKLHIKPPTVNVTVQRLEKAGFLYREADEKDQRISRIYMTEKGKQAKESGMKKVQDNEKILLDGFSEEDLCLLRRFLDQITEHFCFFRLTAICHCRITHPRLSMWESSKVVSKTVYLKRSEKHPWII